jgi:hypothetical protein
MSANFCLIFPSLSDHLGRAQAPKSQSLGVFTSVVMIVCVGALVVTIQAKVSTGLSRSLQPLIQFSPALASRRTTVRAIPVSLLLGFEEMCAGHSSKDSVPLATASPHWTSLPLSLALFALFMFALPLPSLPGPGVYGVSQPLALYPHPQGIDVS